jgi:acid phosphatase (class A)
MRRVLTVLAAGTVLAGTGVAIAQQAAAPPPPPAVSPYLGPERWPDATKIVSQAPAAGSAREAQDQAVFKATRALEGQARWTLAQADVPTLPSAMLKNFSCAAGVEMTPQNAPKLTMLLSRVGVDSGRQVASVKDVFKRKRPYLIDEGQICVPKTDALAASPDYPSGHATWGWAIGLILAELAPDKATPILARGRQFGESRVVCGVHSVSAVEAGRTNGAALVATLHGDAAFRADLEAARLELAAVRKAAGATPASCAVETETLAKPAW